MTVMTQNQINALNEQMTDGKTAHDVAMENGLELVQWHDQSGGLYRNQNNEFVFGWQDGSGFDDQVD